MFSRAQKEEHLNGKPYIKKGKEGGHLGRIVKIDWDLPLDDEMVGGIHSPDEADKEIKRWIQTNDRFIVTDFSNWGMSSTLTLDHRFIISGYRVYDPDTLEYLYQSPTINGDGKYKRKA
jgi:hypothetical protein